MNKLNKLLIKLINRNKSRTKPKKISFIALLSLQGIGDTLMNTVAIHEIRKKWPKAKITIFILSGGVKEILKNNNDIDEIILLPKNKFSLLKELRKNKFDLSFLFWPAGIGSGLLNATIKSKYKVSHSYHIGNKQYNFNSDKAPIENLNVNAIHTVEENNKLLTEMNIKIPKKQEYHYQLSEKDKEFAEKFFEENNLLGKKVIGIHPGGDKKNPQKRWSVEKTAKLTAKLSSKYKVVIILGPDEIEYKTMFEENYNTHIIKNKKIGEVAEIINKLDILITFDSGNGHLASAMKTKTITIIGPTNYKRTQPWGENNFSVKTKHTPLCSPCYKYLDFKFSCPHNIKCLREISEEDIFEVVKKIIN